MTDQAIKKKVTLRLAPDEVAVVADRDWWEYLMEVFNSIGDQLPVGEQEYWYDSAKWINSWIERARPRKDIRRA